MLSFNERFLSMREWITPTEWLGRCLHHCDFLDCPVCSPLVKSLPQRPGAYGTRCFSPNCDCDFQPGSCRGMPRGERPIGKRPELAAPYGNDPFKRIMTKLYARGARDQEIKWIPYPAPKNACRWPDACKCHARMGNDFFYLPIDRCVS